MKYAKLARSQISATVSGYNCGNANVLRTGYGRGYGRGWDWREASRRFTFSSAASHPAFCRISYPFVRLACMSLRFVCLLDLRPGKDFMCLRASWMRWGHYGGRFTGGLSGGRARTNRRVSVCVRVCGLPACPHDNLLCMKSAASASAPAPSPAPAPVPCPSGGSLLFLLTGAMFFAQFAKAMPGTKQICRAAQDRRRKPANRPRLQIRLQFRMRIPTTVASALRKVGYHQVLNH